MRPARRASRLEGEWDWRVEGVEPCRGWSCAFSGGVLEEARPIQEMDRTYSIIDRDGRDAEGLSSRDREIERPKHDPSARDGLVT